MVLKFDNGSLCGNTHCYYHHAGCKESSRVRRAGLTARQSQRQDRRHFLGRSLMFGLDLTLLVTTVFDTYLFRFLIEEDDADDYRIL